MAELRPIKYQKELQKTLRPDNEFYMKAGKVDDNTGSFEKIQYNYANAIGKGKTGSPSLPLSIKTKEHGFSEYSTVQIYNDPYLIKNEDEMLTNFSKQQDMIDQLTEEFKTQIADIAANAWGTTNSDYMVKSSGTATRTNSLVNGTGNIKRIVKADILNIVKLFKKMNIPASQIIGVLTPDQYEDLLLIEDFISYDKVGVPEKLAKGFIGNIMGINFMTRWNETLGSIGLHYSTADAKKDNYKADGTANTITTDRAAALFFAPNYVRHSLKTPRIVINRDAPGYLGGTIIEGFGRYGATISRQHDDKGVAVIIEAS